MARNKRRNTAGRCHVAMRYFVLYRVMFTALNIYQSVPKYTVVTFCSKTYHTISSLVSGHRVYRYNDCCKAYPEWDIYHGYVSVR